MLGHGRVAGFPAQERPRSRLQRLRPVVLSSFLLDRPADQIVARVQGAGEALRPIASGRRSFMWSRCSADAGDRKTLHQAVLAVAAAAAVVVLCGRYGRSRHSYGQHEVPLHRARVWLAVVLPAAAGEANGDRPAPLERDRRRDPLKRPARLSSLKLWMLDRSETTIRYIPGASRVTFLPLFVRLIVKPGPTVPRRTGTLAAPTGYAAECQRDTSTPTVPGRVPCPP